MSFLPGKTNYVRPHVKASFIRPFCGYDKSEIMEKDSFENVSFFILSYFTGKFLVLYYLCVINK